MLGGGHRNAFVLGAIGRYSLVAPGLTTRNKKLLVTSSNKVHRLIFGSKDATNVAPGIATVSQEATV